MVDNKQEYIPGDHWLVCDSCGLTFRRSEMRERWDNLWVCRKDWEPRHPQELVQPRHDRIAVDVARPPEDETTLLSVEPFSTPSSWDQLSLSGGIYKSDGSASTVRTIMWTSILQSGTEYEITIAVSASNGKGEVKIWGDVYDSGWISEGFGSDAGVATGFSERVYVSQRNNFDGVVHVTCRVKNQVTQDDL